jgi:hypothetical protein
MIIAAPSTVITMNAVAKPGDRQGSGGASGEVMVSHTAGPGGAPPGNPLGGLLCMSTGGGGGGGSALSGGSGNGGQAKNGPSGIAKLII